MLICFAIVGLLSRNAKYKLFFGIIGAEWFIAKTFAKLAFFLLLLIVEGMDMNLGYPGDMK